MTPDQDPTNTPTPDTRPSRSPGARIRAAREQMGLSLEALASQTKLTRSTLEALERDQFSALLEPVYVRGYYRKCAKILNLPEAELIRAYEALAGTEQPALPKKIRLSSSADDGSALRWLGLLLVGIAIALGAFLWQLREATTPAPIPLAEVTPSVTAPSQPPSAARPTPVVGGEPVESPGSVAVQPPETLPTAAPQAAASPLPSPAPTTAAEGELTVALNFTQTSWARVNDADGRALINGLMNAGQRQTVRGKPPIMVFLGNAPGVVLTVDGQVVDLRPFTTGNNTARLTLPLP